MHIEKLIRVSLAAFLSFGVSTNALAAGGGYIGNEVPSARSAGQGYVGVAAQSEDPTTVFLNPAGIGELKGTQVTVGAHYENINGKYVNDSGAETKARLGNIAVPNMSATHNLMDGKIGLGFSVQSPFGLETHWGGDSPLRYVATDSRLGIVNMTPAVSYQIHPMVSIGAGAKYVNVFNAQLDRHVNQNALNFNLNNADPGLGTYSDAVSSLRGNGTGWGYDIGLLLKPHEQHSIGVAYHSKVKVRLNGHVSISGLAGTAASASVFGSSNYETSAYTDLNLPENIQVGYAFKPTPKWHLEANAAWYRWSQGRDLNIRYPVANTTQSSVLNTGNPSVVSPRDAWTVATGANYKINEKWQARGGFWYVPHAVPESTFNPAYMDLSRYGISSGAGFSFTKNLTMDIAYSAVFFKKRHIHNSLGTTVTGIPDPGIPALGVPSADIDGSYKNFTNLLAFNFHYKFGI